MKSSIIDEIIDLAKTATNFWKNFVRVDVLRRPNALGQIIPRERRFNNNLKQAESQ